MAQINSHLHQHRLGPTPQGGVSKFLRVADGGSLFGHTQKMSILMAPSASNRPRFSRVTVANIDRTDALCAQSTYAPSPQMVSEQRVCARANIMGRSSTPLVGTLFDVTLACATSTLDIADCSIESRVVSPVDPAMVTGVPRHKYLEQGFCACADAVRSPPAPQPHSVERAYPRPRFHCTECPKGSGDAYRTATG